MGAMTNLNPTLEESLKDMLLRAYVQSEGIQDTINDWLQGQVEQTEVKLEEWLEEFNSIQDDLDDGLVRDRLDKVETMKQRIDEMKTTLLILDEVNEGIDDHDHSGGVDR